MSSENLERIARIYDAWTRGDFSAEIGVFDPEMTFVIDDEIPEGGTYEGLEGLSRYTRGFLDAWESLTIAAESLEEGGDSVLARVRQDGVGKDSGATVTLNYFHLWTLRDGRVIRLESIMREEKALEAAARGGLPDP